MKNWTLILLFFSIIIVSTPDTSAADDPKSTDGVAGVKAFGKKVFGYLTYGDTKWNSSSYGSVPVDSIPWDVLTHATLFAAGGGVPIPSSYLSQLQPLSQRAHQEGVYAGLCYGGSSDDGLIGTVNSSSSWPAWIDYNLGLIDDYGLDFLEFDFEGSVNGTSVYGFFDVLYDSLQVRRSVNNPAVAPFIVLTVGPSRAASWANLAPFVDFVNLMSYDYIGDWWGRMIFDCAPKSYQYFNGTGTNLDYYSPVGSSNAPAPSIQQGAIRVRDAGWPLDKIVVGFDANPTYWNGGSFTGGRGPTYIRQPSNGSTSSAGSNLDFSSTWPTLAQIHPDSIHFDQIAQAYWAHTGTSLSNDKLWVMTTFPGKDSGMWATRQVVDSMDVGGVMFWNIGSEIWNTSAIPPGGRGWFFSQMRKHFGEGGSPPPPADVTPPTVDLTAPTAGDTVSGSVALQALASDNVAVAWVQFYVNGSPLGTAVSAAPYARSWNTAGLANGSYVLKATAADAAGLRASDSVSVVIYHPPVAGDTTAPSVSVTTPAAADTVSGTIQVNLAASDASGITIVKLMVDGALTGATDASSPWSFSWNTATLADGPHTVGAEATDGAGLTTSVSIGVHVSNVVAPPPPPDSTAVSVYGDGLVSPWVNASWGAVTTFTSPEQVYEGSYAIKSVQNGWGAISVHSGSWGTPVAINTSGYDSLQFAVYPETNALTLAVSLENDASGAFAPVVKSNIPANRWTMVSIPVSALNPGGELVHRLNIQNNSSQARVYHVDRVILGADTVASGVTPLAAPLLDSPPDGSIDQAVRPQLSWNAVAGATAYHLQVALDPLFTTVVTEDQAVPGTSFQADTLGAGTLFYWRVRAMGEGTAGNFSATYSFTTTEATVSVDNPGASTPRQYSLEQNYPNPFNPTTTIGFGLPRASQVTIRAYDVSGREVKTIFEGELGTGFSSVQWDSRNNAGETLASGIYYYRIEAFATDGSGRAFTQSRKMVLLK